MKPHLVNAHSSAWDSAVNRVKAQLEAVRKDIVDLQARLYGHNLAKMSDGHRGRFIKTFPVKKQIRKLQDREAELRRELRHLGA